METWQLDNIVVDLRLLKAEIRSSANATKHGLGGTFNLLGRERVDDYLAHRKTWLRSFKRRSPAELLVLEPLIDLDWRLRRCMRLEHEHFLTTLEEKMKTTPEHKANGQAEGALTAMKSIIETTASGIPPSKREDVSEFATLCKTVVGFVRQADCAPLKALANLEKAIAALDDAAWTVGADTAAAYVQVGEVAKSVAKALVPGVKQSNAVLARAKKIMADTMLLVDDKEGKKLARYHDQLQRQMAKQTELLGAVKRQIQSSGARKGSSFGKGFQPAPVMLRVVR